MPTELTWPAVLTAAPRGRRPRRSPRPSWAMEQVMAGRGDAGPARRLPRRAAGQGRDGRRDRRIPRRDPRERAAAAGRPDGARHRRHRRRPLRHGERLDDGGGRRRGSRRSASSSTATRRRSSASGSSDVLAALGIDLTLPPERVAAVLDEVGHHLRVRRAVPPRLPARRPDARRARHPDRLQLPRPAVQPGAPRGVGGRRRAARPGAADRRRVPDARRDGARVPRRRRPRRAHDHRAQPRLGGLARRRCTEHDLDPRDLGHPARDDRRPARRRRRAQRRRSSARVLAGEQGPVRDIVLLNAAAGLVSWELAHDHTLGEQDIRARFRDKIAVAAEAIDSGAAAAKLDAWVAATRR